MRVTAQVSETADGDEQGEVRESSMLFPAAHLTSSPSAIPHLALARPLVILSTRAVLVPSGVCPGGRWAMMCAASLAMRWSKVKILIG